MGNWRYDSLELWPSLLAITLAQPDAASSQGTWSHVRCSRVWSRDGLAAAGSHQEACTVAATSLRDGDVYSDAQNDLQVW